MGTDWRECQPLKPMSQKRDMGHPHPFVGGCVRPGPPARVHKTLRVTLLWRVALPTTSGLSRNSSGKVRAGGCRYGKSVDYHNFYGNSGISGRLFYRLWDKLRLKRFC